MTAAYLDLDAVQAFVRIADLGSFTRAAEASQTTQSAISLKLKRLEKRLGCRLVERTPRHVQLSVRGVEFLGHARQLLDVHDRACTVVGQARKRLIIGISDHVAGPELPALIAHMNNHDPQLLVEIQIGSSADLLRQFDRREIDTAIVRVNNERNDGELIAEERFDWFAAPNWTYRADEPLPLITMPEPCGVRTIASDLLDEAGVSWREVFVGGGVSTVAAAVTAGIGVSALAPRMLPLGAVNVGKRLGLPKLPCLPILCHSRIDDEAKHDALAVLSAAFRAAVVK